ncbi:MAG: triose-phosphate isomerase [Nanoarchaeota archaeon]|nr:triose-phosphate isomerase [Nanoarchaeota archaeon]MBU1270315.1 triose-phosphate isomerase [Nanoarchaeota archaeon]MBU1603964.1 triose-phosphate isomerase [Nanoarchaeota archaeon]MBU2443005.1 triose-phosphate isomerase [Nanoarchaeota archaeon]
MKTPIIIVNFKAYKEGTGRNAVKLAKICEKVAKKTKKNIAIAVEEVDIRNISSKVKIPVLSEHLDSIREGAHTGNNLAEAIKENGAWGTLLNHSENRLRIDQLEESIKRAREVGLKTVVCANNSEIAEAVAAFEPDMIAIEPPELIGGDISVSTAKPQVITDTIKKVKRIANIPVLCGAGIKSGADVKKAIKLGAKGILVASGIVKAKDPEKALTELADAL